MQAFFLVSRKIPAFSIEKSFAICAVMSKILYHIAETIDDVTYYYQNSSFIRLGLRLNLMLALVGAPSIPRTMPTPAVPLRRFKMQSRGLETEKKEAKS